MRVAIAGAGAVGRSVAAELLENGHEVLLIDKDPRAIRPDSVAGAEWLLADACELSSLDGTNGFRINGELVIVVMNDKSPFVVCEADFLVLHHGAILLS